MMLILVENGPKIRYFPTCQFLHSLLETSKYLVLPSNTAVDGVRRRKPVTAYDLQASEKANLSDGLKLYCGLPWDLEGGLAVGFCQKALPAELAVRGRFSKQDALVILPKPQRYVK